MASLTLGIDLQNKRILRTGPNIKSTHWIVFLIKTSSSTISRNNLLSLQDIEYVQLLGVSNLRCLRPGRAKDVWLIGDVSRQNT